MRLPVGRGSIARRVAESSVILCCRQGVNRVKQIARSDAAQDATPQIAKPPLHPSRGTAHRPALREVLDPAATAATMTQHPEGMPGTHDEPPLTGIRIVEFAALGPVPLAGMLLADLGADVLRVQRVGRAELDVIPPDQRDAVLRGRRFIRADLTDPESAAAGRRADQPGRRADRGLPPGRPGAARPRTRRVLRRQPGSDLRPDDRLGAGRSRIAPSPGTTSTTCP